MFKNEKSLEKRIRELINEHVARESEILVLEYKTISDIIICRQGHSPGIFFIEVKHYKQYERIGIGNQKGEGIQPEILKKRPEYLESNLRWLIGQFHEGGNQILVCAFWHCFKLHHGSWYREKQAE